MDPVFRTPVIRHNLNTRSNTVENSITYNVGAYRNNYGKRTNYHIVPYILNDLPEELRNMQDFKKTNRNIQNLYKNNNNWHLFYS